MEIVKGFSAEEAIEALLRDGFIRLWVPGRGSVVIELGADLGNGDGFHRLAPRLREMIAPRLRDSVPNFVPDVEPSPPEAG